MAVVYYSDGAKPEWLPYYKEAQALEKSGRYLCLFNLCYRVPARARAIPRLPCLASVNAHSARLPKHTSSYQTRTNTTARVVPIVFWLLCAYSGCPRRSSSTRSFWTSAARGARAGTRSRWPPLGGISDESWRCNGVSTELKSSTSSLWTCVHGCLGEWTRCCCARDGTSCCVRVHITSSSLHLAPWRLSLHVLRFASYTVMFRGGHCLHLLHGMRLPRVNQPAAAVLIVSWTQRVASEHSVCADGLGCRAARAEQVRGR